MLREERGCGSRSTRYWRRLKPSMRLSDRFGPDRSGFERSGELQRRHDRLAAIRAAKARLEPKAPGG